LKSKTVDAIRDLALQYENKDLQVAFELMKLAHEERPQGPFIKRKYLQYQNDLEILSENQSKIIELVGNGNIAIVPIGFRCFTTKLILENFGVKNQVNLPFDSGFFSPNAVASVMQSKKISLTFDDQGNTHSVCIKNEKIMMKNMDLV
jgi:hypothetical protein